MNADGETVDALAYQEAFRHPGGWVPVYPHHSFTSDSSRERPRWGVHKSTRRVCSDRSGHLMADSPAADGRGRQAHRGGHRNGSR